MASQRWLVGGTQAVYAAVFAWALVRLPAAGTVRRAMLAFAVLVLLSDWVEYRASVGEIPATVQATTLALVIRAGILVLWTLATTLPPARLGRYFALLAGVFFLEAAWDGTLVGVEPLEVLRRGHANLVALCLVFGATADGLRGFYLPLLGLAVFGFLVRKSFVWRDLFRERREATPG